MKYVSSALVLCLLSASLMAQSRHSGIDASGSVTTEKKVDLKLKTEFVDGYTFLVGTWANSGMEFGVILDEQGLVTITWNGTILATGAETILDDLPGGSEAATAGMTGCWMTPGPTQLPTLIPTYSDAASAGAAVAEVKQKVAELKAGGYVPLPGSACDPQPEPGLGPVGMH